MHNLKLDKKNMCASPLVFIAQYFLRTGSENRNSLSTYSKVMKPL